MDMILKSLMARINPNNEPVAILYDKNYQNIVDFILSTYGSLIVDKHCIDNHDPDIRTKEILCSIDNRIIFTASKIDLWHNEYRINASKEKTITNFLHPTTELLPSYLTLNEHINSYGLFNSMKSGHNWRITSEKGMDLSGEITKSGPFNEDGSDGYGDFPFGEVGFIPVPGSVNGTLVFDGKVQHIGFLKEPLMVTVKDDKIIDVKGGFSNEYHALIHSEYILQYISEISFGVNPNIVTSSIDYSIVEEKNLGTGHIGHGGQGSHGKRRGPHFDAVYDRPTLYIDEEKVIDNGVIRV